MDSAKWDLFTFVCPRQEKYFLTQRSILLIVL